ncbi:hypothetical protein G7046_g3479 [Stylonectria norvegica]|nr:hypothetical protein G7046_g3479 [Stylonectria norvegica]
MHLADTRLQSDAAMASTGDDDLLEDHETSSESDDNNIRIGSNLETERDPTDNEASQQRDNEDESDESNDDSSPRRPGHSSKKRLPIPSQKKVKPDIVIEDTGSQIINDLRYWWLTKGKQVKSWNLEMVINAVCLEIHTTYDLAVLEIGPTLEDVVFPPDVPADLHACFLKAMGTVAAEMDTRPLTGKSGGSESGLGQHLKSQVSKALAAKWSGGHANTKKRTHYTNLMPLREHVVALRWLSSTLELPQTFACELTFLGWDHLQYLTGGPDSNNVEQRVAALAKTAEDHEAKLRYLQEQVTYLRVQNDYVKKSYDTGRGIEEKFRNLQQDYRNDLKKVSSQIASLKADPRNNPAALAPTKNPVPEVTKRNEANPAASGHRAKKKSTHLSNQLATPSRRVQAGQEPQSPALGPGSEPESSAATLERLLGSQKRPYTTSAADPVQRKRRQISKTTASARKPSH